jgi:twitching motility protein PilJ
MAISLRLPKVFGAGKGMPADDLDMPTTQVRAAQPGYDPLASVSIMEQLRSATSEMRMPKPLPIVGHLPIVRQFQVLGVLMVTFLVLAAVMMFVDGRLTTQAGVAESTATEMQMLSQRLARGTALAAQGQTAAFPGLKDSRERFKSDLEALQNGGTVRGVSLDVPSDDAVTKILQEIKGRWDRVDVNAGRVLENQQSLTTLAKGLDNINQGNNAILELAQQAAQQVGQGGGSLREIEYTNQLAVLSQRIAKNANALASAEEIDPEVAFLLGKDAGTFRDILNGLLKGSDALRLTGVRNEEARGTLAELQKRFATYDQGVAAILQNMNRLVAAKQAARGINNESDALLSDTTKLAEQYESGSRTRVALWAALVFALLALIFLVLLGKVFLDDARIRAVESEGENKRNQRPFSGS